ncbi:hypothetical protein [Rhizobium tubonense]|uniref:Auto-transporter adhesin head GIN domain-containing protein n=1 Tax=Rhizobium tubonense TaxID=484088 RepID=A0A2W4C3H7_9HYPH|nr:hypothetical protein [Rhizobium tubonense]PZM07611.1 hypothetical protein CPY51_31290 [Rhizobium tubonense]
MNPLLFALIFLASAVAASSEETDLENRLDLSSATAIAITGEASTIDLTTLEDAPYVAAIDSRRSGWFSFWNSIWSYDDCRSSSRMRLDGSTLRVDVSPSPWFGASDCVVAIRANIKKESAVSIEQKALKATLSGNFSSVDIESEAADIGFVGHAKNVDIRGKATRANLVFDAIHRDETVAIDSKMLDVYLGFGSATAISYLIDAKASFVDNALPSTPGAKPSVVIRGDFVRSTIR